MGIKILETTANSISAEYYESISDGSSSDAAYLQWVLNADGESTRSQRTSDKSNNYAVTFTGLTANKSYYLTGTLYDANGGKIEGNGTPVTTLQGDKTVTIYANDGTGQSVSNTFPFGTTITIPDCPFSAPPGKTFAGYAGTASATSAQWQPGQTTTVYVDRVFYCVWQEITVPTHTISYNANGGYGAPSSQTVREDTNVQISTTIPSRSGYTFANWVSVGLTSGYTMAVSPGQTLGTTTEDIELTAEWYQYSVDVIAGDYIANVSRQYQGIPFIDYNGNTQTSCWVDCTLSSQSGYQVTFDGWYNASDVKVSSAQRYTVSGISSNLALTAKATATVLATYTVTYAPGANGVGSTQTQTKTEGTAITLRGVTFTRDGYVQTGWSLTDGGAKAYSLGAQYTQDASVTLYPYWQKETADVTTIDNLPAGTIVKDTIDGAEFEFIVVNQGVPQQSSLYDSSCNGTWLMLKQLYNQQVWNGSGSTSLYSGSQIATYLNGDFYNLLSANLRNALQTAKIPYASGTSVSAGTSGVESKVFLLSALELGLQNGLSENFGENSWADIILACQTKTVPDTWNVGDSCSMTINNKTYAIDIIGKNHDDYADGSGKAPLTFQMHTTYATQYKMNGAESNSCGWVNCLVRTSNAFPTLRKVMPAEVVAAMKAVTKKTSAGSASSAIDTTEDTLFLLSEIEVQGTRTFSYAGEGTQYEYYKTAANRKKNRAWYLRSPRLDSTSCFDRTGWSGEADWSVASEVDGIAAAWCF